MITGTIVLYTKGGLKIRSAFYLNKENREDILERWCLFYGEDFDSGYYQIDPYIKPEKKVEEVKKLYVKRPPVVKETPLKEIEMPDYLHIGPFKKQTYYHKCYGG